MASLLHGTAPSDPLALALAILTLTTACLLACLIPALRAAGMAPAEALRSE
jgi:ABC-type lipoprotein release transport system permease subunit